MDLKGLWKFSLDSDNQGETHSWFAKELSESIQLPGTTDIAQKGYPLDTNTMRYEKDVMRTQWPGTALPQRADEAGTLARQWLYIGKAWYQKEIVIPEAWKCKRLHFTMERVIWRTKVWLDDTYIGTCDSLVAPHSYYLPAVQPGKHKLTVCIDNAMQHNIGLIGHSYGPETQSQWNGIAGNIKLEATDSVMLRDISLYPDITKRSVRVRAAIDNTTGQEFTGNLTLRIQPNDGEKPIQVEPVVKNLKLVSSSLVTEIELNLDSSAQFWSEFNPVLYNVKAELSGTAGELHVKDNKSATFGLREIHRQGRQITVNNHRVFLRGTLDCCVYPKTAYPPMTVPEWIRIFKTIKEHGFNHVRFHSWCPPEAAFTAGDMLGMYLAPETSFWVDGWTVKTSSHPKLFGFDPDAVDYVRNEIRRISDAYGNHPSFAFFCIGNEFGMESDWAKINEVLQEAKAYDPRRLYSATTARKRVVGDDFWITHSTGKNATRGIGPAHTDWDFSAAAQESPIPLIGHETGQRPVFPDYDDFLPKFTGPLIPYNYLRLQRVLQQSGLANQTKDFERASARFQLIQYKAEHEAMLRTADYAGYQLLMLNDFTGQSEALVGILDPFWESKGVVNANEVRQWNNSIVPLARFKSYTWTSDQTFDATLQVAHFGLHALQNTIAEWAITMTDGTDFSRGQIKIRHISPGGLSTLDEISVPLSKVQKPEALDFKLIVSGNTNQWRIWVYPNSPLSSVPEGCMIASQYDADVQQALSSGRRVLLIPGNLKNERAAKAGFPAVYWSAGWWGNKFSSLGILCNPSHAALRHFPNDGYSDWQWQSLIQGGTVFDLTGVPAGYTPIVQSVPDFHYSRFLGLIFETKVGAGRLLVCGLNLNANNPAAKAMKRSLLEYIGSPTFNPVLELDSGLLRELLVSASNPLGRQ